MHILIKGGAGYIGSHVVKLLIENSEESLDYKTVLTQK